jgi:hypothetical protein
MPLDPMMSDALLGTFRNMAKEIKSKNIVSEDADKMYQALERMEELARTNDDMNAFSGQVMQENLYGKFSDYYGKVLSAQAAASSSAGDYSDANLLKQNLDALRDAISRIRTAKEEALETDRNYDPKKAVRQSLDFINRNKEKFGLEKGVEASGGIEKMKAGTEKDIDKEISEKPNAFDNSVEIEKLINAEGIIKPIENLIALGEEQGMTYPRYLRLQMEKSLDKAMEGNVIARDGYEYLYEFYKALPYAPGYVEKAKKKLDLFDQLGSKSKFGIPNSDEISYGHRRIDYEFEPSIILWKNITDRWESLLDNLYWWSLAHIDIAPNIQPWCLDPDPPKSVKDTKNTSPGIFRQQERLFIKYHDLGFMDIFKHPTFVYQVKNDLIGHSQEMVEFLIEKVYPNCQPFKFLPQDIISERKALYVEKREVNPDALKPSLRMVANYDRVFGEGRFVSKFGPYKPLDTKAKPWDWSF